MSSATSGISGAAINAWGGICLQSTPRSAPRLKHLRKHAQLSAQEQAIEDFMRYNSPARFSEYEALQLAADASWQAADSALLSVNAIAKVPSAASQLFLV